MSLAKTVQYYSYLIRYPQYREFISMGYGIEARYVRNKAYWDKHCSLTKEFIRDSLRSLSGGISIVVFGSGRLYDFPDDICDRATQVTLVDADPVAVSVSRNKLKRFGSKIHCMHLDITGHFKKSSVMLERFLRSKKASPEELGDFLSGLSFEGGVTEIAPHDVSISLNILGQLPVYFRDRWGALIEKHTPFKRDVRDEFDPAIEAGLCRRFAALQRDHISYVKTTAKKLCLFTNDIRFFYYNRDLAPWESYDALYIKNLRGEFSAPPMLESSWLWHIAPQGVEEKDYGSIHQIEASAFRM